MHLTIVAVNSISATCAPSVAQTTLMAIVRVESGLDPLAIGVNGVDSHRLHPRSEAEAIATATQLISVGRNVDLGLGQINSGNLGRLGDPDSDSD